VNLFSFFTIESNMLAIVVLLIGGVLDPGGARWAWLRGAATLYMVITGIVYAALLANAEVGLTAAWVDSAMHQVTPIVLLADWIFFPPWPRAAYRKALVWLAFPLAFRLLADPRCGRGLVALSVPYPGHFPWSQQRSWKMCVRIARFSSIRKKVSTIIARAGFPGVIRHHASVPGNHEPLSQAVTRRARNRAGLGRRG
jgi:hypothetical protein